MKNVEWGTYKINELFTKLNLKLLNQNFVKDKDLSREKTSEFNLPLVNAKDGSNGIMYYARESDFESDTMSIDIVNDGAISTGNVYSQPQKTGVLYNAYLIKPKLNRSIQTLHFYTTSIFKAIKHKYSYENKAGWEKVKNDEIWLPIQKNSIDFSYMHDSIMILENAYIEKIYNYLNTLEINDTNLTINEKYALDTLSSKDFKDFKVTDIFVIKNTGNILSSWIKENSGTTPYLCASAANNSVSSYIQYNEDYLDKGNCIFIGGKTFVVTYQKDDFFSNDSHNLTLKLKEEEHRNKICQLFLATCIKNSLGHKYSWGDSISSSKIKKDSISLPVKDGQPDYEFMENYISAIQKLTVKKVISYLDEKKSKLAS